MLAILGPSISLVNSSKACWNFIDQIEEDGPKVGEDLHAVFPLINVDYLYFFMSFIFCHQCSLNFSVHVLQ